MKNYNHSISLVFFIHFIISIWILQTQAKHFCPSARVISPCYCKGMRKGLFLLDKLNYRKFEHLFKSNAQDQVKK